MRFFSGIFGFLLFALAVTFALSNRQTAIVSLWPFDAQIEAPLFLLTLGALFLGAVLGGLFVWIAMIPHRIASKRLKKEIAVLRGKIEDLQQTVLPPRSSMSLSMPRPKFGWRLRRPR